MLTPRQTIAMCSPGLAVLVLSLGWWALDRAHAHLTDRGIRLLDRLRL